MSDEHNIEASDGQFDYQVTVRESDSSDMSHYSRDEVEQRAKHWFGVALDMRNVQDQLAADLELALNACQRYGQVLAELEMADPYLVEIHKLLTKYNMSHAEAAQTARVYVDGQDITEHPDSIDGTLTAELVQTEDGKFHWLLKQGEDIPEADVLAEEPEPAEPVDPETRDWLTEPNDVIEEGPLRALDEENRNVARAFNEEVTRRLNEYIESRGADTPSPSEIEALLETWENEGGATGDNGN